MTLMLVHVGVFWAIAVGLPLGIAAAVVLLWRFRARVGWSMRETAGRGGENSAAIRPALAAAAPARPEQNLAIKVVGPNKVLTTAVATSPALAARRQLWRVALVYTGAVTVAVLITVNILRIVSPMDSSPRLLLLNSMYFAAFVPVFAPPVVLAASYVMRKQVLYLILAVLALLAVIGLWDIFKFKGGLFNLWLWYCAVPTLIALFLATRRLRAVGPIVIVGTAVWSAVSFVLISVGCLYALNFVGLHFARPDLRELSLPIAAEKYIVELSENSLTDVLAAYSTIWSGAGEGSIYTIDHPERDRKAGLVALVMILLALIVGAVAAWTAFVAGIPSPPAAGERPDVHHRRDGADFCALYRH